MMILVMLLLIMQLGFNISVLIVLFWVSFVSVCVFGLVVVSSVSFVSVVFSSGEGISVWFSFCMMIVVLVSLLFVLFSFFGMISVVVLICLYSSCYSDLLQLWLEVIVVCIVVGLVCLVIREVMVFCSICCFLGGVIVFLVYVVDVFVVYFRLSVMFVFVIIIVIGYVCR